MVSTEVAQEGAAHSSYFITRSALCVLTPSMRPAPRRAVKAKNVVARRKSSPESSHGEFAGVDYICLGSLRFASL
jgi:hypothetical protein